MFQTLRKLSDLQMSWTNFLSGLTVFDSVHFCRGQNLMGENAGMKFEIDSNNGDSETIRDIVLFQFQGYSQAISGRGDSSKITHKFNIKNASFFYSNHLNNL
ncbi:hypothetical protein ACF0H5_005491 [Mactra antiquata]